MSALGELGKVISGASNLLRGSGGSNSGMYSNPHNDLTYQWMQEANMFNAQQAAINRNFQMEMSNTAYQRAMEDMRKAGLNPILAGNLGGASTPSGSQATANFTSANPTTSSWSSSYQNSAFDSIMDLGRKAASWVASKSTEPYFQKLAEVMTGTTGPFGIRAIQKMLRMNYGNATGAQIVNRMLHNWQLNNRSNSSKYQYDYGSGFNGSDRSYGKY